MSVPINEQVLPMSNMAFVLILVAGPCKVTGSTSRRTFDWRGLWDERECSPDCGSPCLRLAPWIRVWCFFGHLSTRRLTGIGHVREICPALRQLKQSWAFFAASAPPSTDNLANLGHTSTECQPSFKGRENAQQMCYHLDDFLPSFLRRLFLFLFASVGDRGR